MSDLSILAGTLGSLALGVGLRRALGRPLLDWRQAAKALGFAVAASSLSLLVTHSWNAGRGVVHGRGWPVTFLRLRTDGPAPNAPTMITESVFIWTAAVACLILWAAVGYLMLAGARGSKVEGSAAGPSPLTSVPLLAVLVPVLTLAACASVADRENLGSAPDTILADSAPGRVATISAPGNRVGAGRGLVYEYQFCATYTFDSSQGTVVRRRHEGGADTVRVALSPGAFEAIVEEADRIGLWSYPSAFGDSLTIDAAEASENGSSFVVPYGDLRIDLRDGTRSASVGWSNRITGPLSPEAERLRALARKVETAIGLRTAVERFPPLGYTCL